MKIIILTILLFLQGCVSTGTITDVIEAGSKGASTIIVANAVDTLADTRKIKASTVSSIKDDVLKSKTLIALAKNSRYVGLLEGASIWLFLIVIARVIRYAFRIYKPQPTKETKEY